MKVELTDSEINMISEWYSVAVEESYSGKFYLRCPNPGSYHYRDRFFSYQRSTKRVDEELELLSKLGIEPL